MKRLLGMTALAVVLATGSAYAQTTVKIGILSDMSSLYADIGGPGSVAAAKLAVADFAKTNPDVKVEMISGDHQNKPDIGTNIANQWFDVDKVDMVIVEPLVGDVGADIGLVLVVARDHLDLHVRIGLGEVGDRQFGGGDRARAANVGVERRHVAE